MQPAKLIIVFLVLILIFCVDSVERIMNKTFDGQIGVKGLGSGVVVCSSTVRESTGYFNQQLPVSRKHIKMEKEDQIREPNLKLMNGSPIKFCNIVRH